jgi:predicted dienelactone hydrolase
MKLVHAFPILAVIACFSTTADSAEIVGTSEMRVASAARGNDLSVRIWYPAEAGGEAALVGDNKIFKGAWASLDAPVIDGKLPLIVLSHGSGGRVEGMTWLATHLAAAGFVVAGPNHPGTMSGDSTPADTPKIWERTQDLSDVMIALTTDPRWSRTIDSDRIGVLGFSLGGAAAMEIVGAQANLEAYARYCDDSPAMMDCRWYAGGRGYVDGVQVRVEKVDLRKIDKERFEQSNLDKRVKSAVLVDPGLATVFDQQTVRAIAIPVTFINLGRAGAVPLAVEADKLVKLTPHGMHAHVVDSVHFSFLPECKEGAAEVLKAFGEDDPLCEDGGNRSRADIHAEVQRLTLEAFKRSLLNPM